MNAIDVFKTKQPPTPRRFKSSSAAHARIFELETLLGVSHVKPSWNIVQATEHAELLEKLLHDKTTAQTAIAPSTPAPPMALPTNLTGLERAIHAQTQKHRARASIVPAAPIQKTAVQPASPSNIDLGDLCAAVYGMHATFRIIEGSKDRNESDAKIRQRFFRDNLKIPGASMTEFPESDKLPAPTGLERVANNKKQAAIAKFFSKTK